MMILGDGRLGGQMLCGALEVESGLVTLDTGQ